MLKLAEIFSQFYAPRDGAAIDVGDFDILTMPNPKPGLMGISMGEDVLMVDFRTQMSFRIKSGNLGLRKKILVFNRPGGIPREMLAKYFDANMDNPYALTYAIARLGFSANLGEFTQVPPMNVRYRTPEDRKRKSLLLQNTAREMDVLFSRPLSNSPISRVVRKIDRCQFSHVGAYTGNGLTSDAGPDGVEESPLSDLIEENHVALYRLRKPLSAQQGESALAFMHMNKGGKYNWKGLLWLAVKKKLSISSSNNGVSDLLFSDAFQLVDYV